MKYIDAERLKAEIKRQKHELELSIQSQGDYGQSCHIVAYDNILSLIDSLQQEQPEVDLNAEIEKEIQLHYNDDQDVYWWNYLKKSFHHFYELGKKDMKEQMMKEAVDAIIYGYDDGSYELIASWLDLPKGIYKNGDKVRIIIVKED